MQIGSNIESLVVKNALRLAVPADSKLTSLESTGGILKQLMPHPPLLEHLTIHSRAIEALKLIQAISKSSIKRLDLMLDFPKQQGLVTLKINLPKL